MAEFNREEIDYEDQLRQSERERKDLKNIIYEHGAVDPYGRLHDV